MTVFPVRYMTMQTYIPLWGFTTAWPWRPEELLPLPRGVLVPLSLADRGDGFPIPGPLEVDSSIGVLEVEVDVEGSSGDSFSILDGSAGVAGWVGAAWLHWAALPPLTPPRLQMAPSPPHSSTPSPPSPSTLWPLMASELLQVHHQCLTLLQFIGCGRKQQP